MSPTVVQPALVETACPACGADRCRELHLVEAEPPAPRGPWRLVLCLECDSVYLNPRPADPVALYDAGYHVYARRGAFGRVLGGMLAGLEALRLAREAGRLGGTAFEIGCGDGATLAALRRIGFEASGIEASLDAARLARARGLEVDEGEFVEGRGVAGRYDLVFAAHVLEHVRDPHSFLRGVRRILRPGGRAVLKLPVAGSWDEALLGGGSGAYDVPYHLLVPSRRALGRMAVDSGLQVIGEGADFVPNDWIHGLRRAARSAFGIPLPFVRPWNPLLALPLLPLSTLAALLGGSGRVRLRLSRPPD